MSKSDVEARQISGEQTADAEPTDYLFVPLFNRFRSNLRRDFTKNESATWIPVECSLLVCYEFAACSLQTRYMFVAILLLCGMRGSDKIPADAKFLANALAADERTVKNQSANCSPRAFWQTERKTERKMRRAQTERAMRRA